MSSHSTTGADTRRGSLECSVAELRLQGPLSLQNYVIKQALNLDCYWPDLNADMTQQELQGPDITDGTYILRPTGDMDEAKRKFLTLSVRMSFPNEAVNVWHFPVIVDVDKDEQGNIIQVYFSLTQNHNKITSLKELLEFYHGRPLRGATLPGVCLFGRGLVYRRGRKQRSYPREVPGGQYIPTILLDTPPPPPPPRDSSKGNPVPSPRTTLSRDVKLVPDLPLIDRSTVPSTCLPSSGAPAVTTYAPEATTPTPTPRAKAPELPRPRQGTPTMNRELESNYDDRKVTECRCGIPKNITALPHKWSVHRSLEPGTRDMLYFKNSKGQTTWALPPQIDKDCKSREYLKHGKLNIKCFLAVVFITAKSHSFKAYFILNDVDHKDYLTYSPSSQLSNFQNYEIYPRPVE